MRVPSAASRFASAADTAACRALLRSGSRTFFAAALVLPRSIRERATGLYAFCRVADDAIDGGGDRCAALDDLRMRLDRIYAGNPLDNPADRAFADSVNCCAIPRAFPSALLDGFEWDAEGRRYQDLSALKAYAVRVAGTVGAMMALVMDVRQPELVARACDLGVAMQLTNIARDVGEDARCGRLYLPLDWLRDAGIDADSWLERPVFDARLSGVIRRLLQSAEDLYARADSGIARLPSACRPGMFAARLLYAEIGQELARGGLDSVNRRAVVPWRRKARLLGAAMLAAARRGADPGTGRLAEAEFLIDAMAPAAPSARLSAGPRLRWRRFEDRVVWLIDLFERLERLERRGLSAGAAKLS
jgi:phytoene synthase